jgi:hypothetical protein
MEYINQRWCAYTGLSLEKSLGYQWMKCLHPDDHDNVASAIASSGKLHKDLDIEFRLKVFYPPFVKFLPYLDFRNTN